MKISGTATMAASPEQVWQAVHDPGVLARSIPGCRSLTELSPGRYAMTVMAGVAAIKGSYDGEVAITDVTEPDRFTMKADGAGAPGTISTTVDVTLAGAEGGGTAISYEADALVGGPIGGVGQRMLAGVARKMAGQMFTALDSDIAGERPAEKSPEPGTAGAAVAEAGGRHTTTYAGSTGSPGVGGSSRDFGSGVLVGGAVALVGVVLGWAIGGRR
ncbi:MULTISPECIES: SRPBCC family protein [unclassified Knoellia]|uniref:SRPBCC family protein n=1 Tax=Knoellia altitudinis TaxID=3404795 RepID=UPI00360A9082